MPLLKSSIALSLNNLVELCVAYLGDQLHSSNCIGFYLFGKKSNCPSLMEIAKQYIFNHFEEVVRHEEFLNLSFHDLCKMIKDDNVKVKCESIVYDVSSSTILSLSPSSSVTHLGSDALGAPCTAGTSIGALASPTVCSFGHTRSTLC